MHFMGHSGTNVCPLSALVPYLAICRIYLCGGWQALLSQSEFRHLLKRALEAAGLKTNQYSSHGLCIGAAILQVSKTI